MFISCQLALGPNNLTVRAISHYGMILYGLENSTISLIAVPAFSVGLMILRKGFTAVNVRFRPGFIAENNIRLLIVYLNSDVRFFVIYASAVDNEAC